MLRLLLIGSLLAFFTGPAPAEALASPSPPTQTPSNVTQTQAAPFPKGQIIEKVLCASQPPSQPRGAELPSGEQSYALYLPSNYSPDRNWPILYAFDPGARGKLPLDRFKDAAERYGWIVAGSNNSHNGSMQASVAAWKSMWYDTHERFAIDQARVYTTGFSGGARVAVMLARICSDCVAGVIGCGAGFPVGVTPAPTMHFTFFGTVGVDDFNFAEVKALEEALLKAGMVHNVRVFSGRHEWAPPPVAGEAVEWMELQAMKAGTRRRDENLINELWKKNDASTKALESANKSYEEYQLLTQMLDTFKGLHDLSEVEKQASQLRDSRAVKDAVREERQQITKQRASQQEIYSLIAGNGGEEAFDSGVRLRAAVAELQKSAKAENDTGERRVARRVSEGLYIGLFEEGMNLLQTQKHYDQAARKFELLVQVAPDRPGAYFNLAWAYALNGEKKKSLQALTSAVEKGFSDRSAITENKAFDSLRNESQYLQVIKTLESRH
jgi:predicted esterase